MGLCRDDTKRKLVAMESQPDKAGAALPAARALLYKLGADRKRLRSIQSFQTRDQIKRAEILPEYLPYVDGILAGDSGEPDEVLVQVMVWAFDAREMELFDRIARYALFYNLPLPAEFSRSTGAWLAESCAKLVLSIASEREALPTSDMEVLSDLVIWLVSETAERDMHDEIRAKLYHAAGDIMAETVPDIAIQHYETALKYRDKEPVKKKIAALQKSGADTTSQSPQGQAADGEDSDVIKTPLAALPDSDPPAIDGEAA